MLACRNGRIDCVQVLLKYNADIDMHDSQGSTPLMEAIQAYSNSVDMVRLLLQKGANPNVRSESPESALIMAITSRRNDCARILLDFNADVNRCGHRGKTALHLATLLGLADSVKLLLQHGAQVNKPTGAFYHHTALMLACMNPCNTSQRNHVECLKLLLEAGADVHIKVSNGFTGSTALSLLVKQAMGAKDAYLSDMVEMLISYGADIRDLLSIVEKTKHRFVKELHVDVLRLVTHHGLDVPLKEYLQDIAGDVGQGDAIQIEEEKVDLIKELTEMSLMNLSRRRIREQLLFSSASQNLVDLVTELNLPSVMKEYLMYK